MMMVVAGFEEQRLWQNTMIPFVNNNLRQISAVGTEFSDVNLPTERLRLGDSNETQSLEIGDQIRGAGYKAPPRTNIYRGRSKIAGSYTGLSSFFGNLSIQSERFSAQSSAFPSDEDEQGAARSLLTIRPALWLARFGIKWPTSSDIPVARTLEPRFQHFPTCF